MSSQRRSERHEQHLAQTYARFLRELEELGVDNELAPKAIESVLCALEQRLIDTEARHLEAQLPRKVRDLLQRCPRHEGAPPRKFNLEQFLMMVAEDLDTTPHEAERLSRAVFATLRERVSEGEVEDVIGQLPLDLRSLWVREA